MTATLDHTTETTVYVVTGVGRDGVRRELWFGNSLRLAVKKQNVDLPKKLGGVYQDYSLEERAFAR